MLSVCSDTYLLLNTNERDEGSPLQNMAAITYAHACNFSLFEATFLNNIIPRIILLVGHVNATKQGALVHRSLIPY